jgi:localization factor PodJL
MRFPLDRRPALRAAAAAGNPAAEYEIGMRYSEGRGVPANLETAVQWFERAANKGVAPALYRLGSLYEKGQGVKKDLEKARQFYIAGADKGNAKAVHNLAVLYAEGIDGKPDYRTASQWFRKAADKGVADSQYNLGILYARGIGVDQNLAESYKWFALAAQQGDQDAAKKREDVAARLDQQSLVAAKLAVQTWAADPPPEEAMNVKAPPAAGTARPPRDLPSHPCGRSRTRSRDAADRAASARAFIMSGIRPACGVFHACGHTWLGHSENLQQRSTYLLARNGRRIRFRHFPGPLAHLRFLASADLKSRANLPSDRRTARQRLLSW